MKRLLHLGLIAKAPEDWRTPRRWRDHEACSTTRRRLGLRRPSAAFPSHNYETESCNHPAAPAFH